MFDGCRLDLSLFTKIKPMLEKNLLKITAMDFGSLYLTSSDTIQEGAFSFLSLDIMLLRTFQSPLLSPVLVKR